MSFENNNIWIIGCSSGIGRALAVALAKLGANLILSARREEELEKLQQEIKNNQHGHTIYPLDVANERQVKVVCGKVAKKQLDRVIFMPALYKPSLIANMDLAHASQTIDVNIKGALYVAHWVLKIFEKQQSGQIALCSSIVAYTGLPNGQPYSATKAAVTNFTQSLRREVPNYIDVKLISPGFVETSLTDKNTFKMPMMVTPKKAAEKIIHELNGNKFEIHFPKKFTYFLKLIAILPYGLQLALKMSKK